MSAVKRHLHMVIVTLHDAVEENYYEGMFPFENWSHVKNVSGVKECQNKCTTE